MSMVEENGFFFFQVTWVIPAVPFRWRSAGGGVLQVTAFIHLHWPQRKRARSYYRLLGSSPVLRSAQQQPGIVRKMFSDIWVGQDGLWLNLGVHCNVLAAGSWANFHDCALPFSPFSSMFQPWLQMSSLKVLIFFFCGHQPANDSSFHYLLNCSLKTDIKTDRPESRYKRFSVIRVYSHPTTSASCDM